MKKFSICSVQFGSVMYDFLWHHEPQCARPPCLSQPPEFTQTHVHSVEDAIHHLILCHPLLLPPSIFPCIRVFSNESAIHIRWSFSFNISPSNEHPGRISFRMDQLDLLAVQGILKSLLQHHRSKASILWCSDFFIFQLSHSYMTSGKTIALTRWISVGKVMSLLTSFRCNQRCPLAFSHLLLSAVSFHSEEHQ